MPRGEATPTNLTPQERADLRFTIVLRVLPYCCLDARDQLPIGSPLERAQRASELAYIIADAVLAARTLL